MVWLRGILCVATASMVLLNVVCITQNYYKAYPGYWIMGTISKTLENVTIVQCSIECLRLHPTCRAFNVQGSPNQYNCELLVSFNYLRKKTEYTLYYDLDMYQEQGYKEELGRLVYYPPAGEGNLDFINTLREKCKTRWGMYMVPRNDNEWNWMKAIFLTQGYSAMWLPIVEAEELGNDEHKYEWSKGPLNYKSVEAPGSLSMSWEDDNMPEGCAPSTICDDDYDCALLRNLDGNLTINITSCLDTHEGYICEPGITDPAIYTRLHH